LCYGRQGREYATTKQRLAMPAGLVDL